MGKSITIYSLSVITNSLQCNKTSKVSGVHTSVRDNRSKSHTPDLDPFVKELLNSLKTSYKIIGGKNLSFPAHTKKYLRELGSIKAIKHYKYHTSRWISLFSPDVLEIPEGYDQNFWFFNKPNRIYMIRRLKKFRFAFQLWQGKRAIKAPLPRAVKKLEYESFKQRLTQDLPVEYQFLENIRAKANKYFKDFIVPSTRMILTNTSCFEGPGMSASLRKEYNIPILKPYRTLLELTHHNIAAKWPYRKYEPHGTSHQIDEPLKVRTITKMHHQQLQYSDIQKKLLHYIQRKSPEFILTRDQNIWNNIKFLTLDTETRRVRNDSGDIVDEVINIKDWFFCSGDYEAATDNLKRRVITAVVGEIPWDREIYKQFGNCLVDDFITTNGQLMGGILSFPILCVINKLIYECVQDLMPKSSTKPVINGDDILFKATRPFIDLWMRYTREAGFIPSKGKSLIDKNNFTINSRPYNRFGPLKFANFKLCNVRGSCLEETQALKNFCEGIKYELNEKTIKKIISDYFPNFGKSKSYKIWRKYRSQYMPIEAGGLALFPMEVNKLSYLQNRYTCHYLTTVRKQPLTPLQREVGVSPFIATEEAPREPIPRLGKYNYPGNFKLTRMLTPDMEKLRYGMLSSRIHESEGVLAFHQ